MEKKHPVSGQTQDNLRRLKPLSAIADLKDSTANKGDNQREKRDYVGKIPKQGGWGSDFWEFSHIIPFLSRIVSLRHFWQMTQDV